MKYYKRWYMKVNGITLGCIEMSLFGLISYSSKSFFTNLQNMDSVLYYWFCLTILTGIWELSFIINYKQCVDYSRELIKKKEHAWFNKYTLGNLLPWKFSKIFYAEYGAWADRDYMMITNYWSRLIEGSHAFLCGLVALHCMINKTEGEERTFLILAALSMGTQLMNSILYMGDYFIQTRDQSSTNYNSSNFPTGFLLTKRGFMYVNIFWTIMPSYCIYSLLVN
jgi:hypothetical protein